jgi:hypothetical protein
MRRVRNAVLNSTIINIAGGINLKCALPKLCFCNNTIVHKKPRVRLCSLFSKHKIQENNQKDNHHNK